MKSPAYVPPAQFASSPPVAYAVPVPPIRRSQHRTDYCMMLKLFIYHLLNAIFGAICVAVAPVGALISLVLVPVCCLGLVTFHVMIRCLAAFDIELYNLIAPPEEAICSSLPPEAALYDVEGQRLKPALSSFSCVSLMALAYFAFIKPLVGSLSAAIVVGIVTLFLMEISVLTKGSVDRSFLLTHVQGVVDSIGSVVGVTLLFVVGLGVSYVLMKIIAWLSQSVTRFFCCEQFHTYSYVHVVQPSHHHYARLGTDDNE
ncbi:hypothetical protein PINS_up023914 [Pythium insidiosum]|nr:hypothetical protein PINS_up023914 [Pythium insidiosum]